MLLLSGQFGRHRMSSPDAQPHLYYGWHRTCSCLVLLGVWTVRSLVGQDLQRIFAAHQQGLLADEEFEQHKNALLTWSRCRFSLRTPKKLRFPKI